MEIETCTAYLKTMSQISLLKTSSNLGLDIYGSVLSSGLRRFREHRTGASMILIVDSRQHRIWQTKILSRVRADAPERKKRGRRLAAKQDSQSGVILLQKPLAAWRIECIKVFISHLWQNWRYEKARLVITYLVTCRLFLGACCYVYAIIFFL